VSTKFYFTWPCIIFENTISVRNYFNIKEKGNVEKPKSKRKVIGELKALNDVKNLT